MQSATSYIEEIERWRAQMEADLRADESWLALAGLYWLKPGRNRAGSAPENEIVLPAHAPAYVGDFDLADGRVSFRAAVDLPFTLDGLPIEAAELRSDKPGPAGKLRLDGFTMQIIQRGERLALRLHDMHNPAREEFAGRIWFPINEQYRVMAEFEPYDPPKPVQTATITGDLLPGESRGRVHFMLDGQALSLEVAPSPGPGLSFVFRDASSGVDSYAAARFLRAAAPEHGRVELDFNRAYNPPCAFTEFATCPLPPPENILAVRIAAGERYHKQNH